LRRDVHLGSVIDVDDPGEQCLIGFRDNLRSPSPPAGDVGEFRLDRREVAKSAARLKRNPRFAFEVGKRCGWQCGICSVAFKALLDAAHIRGVTDKGSDDPRNGIILCKNHHAAFDAGLFNFEPETGNVVFRTGISAAQLGVTLLGLGRHKRPHMDALKWRWERFAPNGPVVAIEP
jgi:hypothetical protein